MREYLPILIVAALIVLSAAGFLLAFLLEKNKKESMGYDRHMEDREIIRRLLRYAKPYRKNFALVLFIMVLSIGYDLASPLLDLVDEGRITVKAGYQLAFLDAEAQRVIYNVFSPGNGMMKEEAARDLRFLAEQQGRLNPNDVRDILRGSKNKEPKVKAVTFKVPMTPGMDAKTVKRIKDDEEFQAALAAWIEDYLKLREADENERQ